MGKDCDFEKIFDDALSEALNEYIEEESSVWEAEMMSIPEPAYSPKYKKFINHLFQKTVHPVTNWKKMDMHCSGFFRCMYSYYI